MLCLDPCFIFLTIHAGIATVFLCPTRHKKHMLHFCNTSKMLNKGYKNNMSTHLEHQVSSFYPFLLFLSASVEVSEVVLELHRVFGLLPQYPILSFHFLVQCHSHAMCTINQDVVLVSLPSNPTDYPDVFTLNPSSTTYSITRPAYCVLPIIPSINHFKITHLGIILQHYPPLALCLVLHRLTLLKAITNT